MCVGVVVLRTERENCLKETDRQRNREREKETGRRTVGKQRGERMGMGDRQTERQINGDPER